MILHMENYCLLLMLVIFIISMIGSLARTDYNATYSLLSYIFLCSYRTKQSLSSVLLALILITAFFTAADIWALFVQNDVRIGKLLGIVIIILEILMKIFLLAMLMAWKFRGEKTNDNPQQQAGSQIRA